MLLAVVVTVAVFCVYRRRGSFGSRNTRSISGAQGDSDSTGCRIIINGALTDARSMKTVNAYTCCLDKSG